MSSLPYWKATSAAEGRNDRLAGLILVLVSYVYPHPWWKADLFEDAPSHNRPPNEEATLSSLHCYPHFPPSKNHKKSHPHDSSQPKILAPAHSDYFETHFEFTSPCSAVVLQTLSRDHSPLDNIKKGSPLLNRSDVSNT